MLKTLQLIALALLAAYAGGALAQADGKIGFVNLDRILRDAAPAVRAQKKLEAEFQNPAPDMDWASAHRRHAELQSARDTLYANLAACWDQL